MGLIFDQETSELYESWYQSPHGRAVDQSIERLLRSQIRPKSGDRVLDVGCGTGHHILNLARLGLDASGVDASPYVIRRARERLGPGVELRTGYAEDLPFDDNAFDVVVLINTLEFLDNPLAALREAGRVAHRRVFVGVLNSLSWVGLIKRIQGYMGDPVFRRAKFYHLWQIKSLMQAAFGDVPISWGCINIGPAFFGRSESQGDQSPFGSFLGVSATMTYRLRTENVPLTVRIKNGQRSLVSVRTAGEINRKTGDWVDERSLPL